MAKKKPSKEEAIEFQAIRPFGPTIIRGTLPKHLLELMDTKATEMLEDEKLSKEFDHSGSLAGNVKQEVRFPTEWMDTNAFLPMIGFIGEMVKSYISIPPANETIKPEFVGKLVMESMWVVSQYAGDFNPFHIHEGQLSGVFYLRVPPSLPEEYAKEDHYPTVGDIFLFPNWLAHGVYPFRTPNEERRSVSFNLHLIKKEEEKQLLK